MMAGFYLLLIIVTEELFLKQLSWKGL